MMDFQEKTGHGDPGGRNEGTKEFEDLTEGKQRCSNTVSNLKLEKLMIERVNLWKSLMIDRLHQRQRQSVVTVRIKISSFATVAAPSSDRSH